MRSREEIFARLIKHATYLYEGNLPCWWIKNNLRREITELAIALELGEKYPDQAPPVNEGSPEYRIRKWILGEAEEK